MTEQRDGITVSGHGEVAGLPDQATMSLGVSLIRPRVAEAMADASVTAGKLYEALAAAGVDSADIQTSAFSITPEYDYSGNRRRMVGFRVANSVTAKLRDIESIGDVIQAAADAAGDDVQVSGIAFTIEDHAVLIAEARDAAWADAEDKADQLAGLAGVARGAATVITETAGHRPPVPVMRAAAMAEGAPAPPIEAGTMTVAVDLTVTFGIES